MSSLGNPLFPGIGPFSQPVGNSTVAPAVPMLQLKPFIAPTLQPRPELVLRSASPWPRGSTEKASKHVYFSSKETPSASSSSTYRPVALATTAEQMPGHLLTTNAPVRAGAVVGTTYSNSARESTIFYNAGGNAYATRPSADMQRPAGSGGTPTGAATPGASATSGGMFSLPGTSSPQSQQQQQRHADSSSGPKARKSALRKQLDPGAAAALERLAAQVESEIQSSEREAAPQAHDVLSLNLLQRMEQQTYKTEERATLIQNLLRAVYDVLGSDDVEDGSGPRQVGPEPDTTVADQIRRPDGSAGVANDVVSRPGPAEEATTKSSSLMKGVSLFRAQENPPLVDPARTAFYSPAPAQNTGVQRRPWMNTAVLVQPRETAGPIADTAEAGKVEETKRLKSVAAEAAAERAQLLSRATELTQQYLHDSGGVLVEGANSQDLLGVSDVVSPDGKMGSSKEAARPEAVRPETAPEKGNAVQAQSQKSTTARDQATPSFDMQGLSISRAPFDFTLQRGDRTLPPAAAVPSQQLSQYGRGNLVVGRVASLAPNAACGDEARGASISSAAPFSQQTWSEPVVVPDIEMAGGGTAPGTGQDTEVDEENEANPFLFEPETSKRTEFSGELSRPISVRTPPGGDEYFLANAAAAHAGEKRPKLIPGSKDTILPSGRENEAGPEVRSVEEEKLRLLEMLSRSAQSSPFPSSRIYVQRQGNTGGAGPFTEHAPEGMPLPHPPVGRVANLQSRDSNERHSLKSVNEERHAPPDAGTADVEDSIPIPPISTSVRSSIRTIAGALPSIEEKTSRLLRRVRSETDPRLQAVLQRRIDSLKQINDDRYFVEEEVETQSKKKEDIRRQLATQVEKLEEELQRLRAPVFEDIPKAFQMALLLVNQHGCKELSWTEGFSPLHWAAQCDRRDILEYLLSKDGGKDLLVARDKKGRLPYDYALASGNKELCEWLAQIGATSVAKPLSECSLEGVPDCYITVLRQVETEGWSNMRWQSDYSLLHWAAKKGVRRLVEYLVELKADLNVPDRLSQRTPLDYASDFGHFEICDFLASSGALARVERERRSRASSRQPKDSQLYSSPLENRSPTRQKQLERTAGDGGTTTSPTKQQNFPVSSGASVSAVARLIFSDPDVYRHVEHEQDLRSVFSSEKGLQQVLADVPEPYLDAISQVAKRGWNRMKWANNFTLLHWAARAGRVELCQYFLVKGADFRHKDDFHRSALDYARRKTHANVELLFVSTE